jgi:hypothetical protein
MEDCFRRCFFMPKFAIAFEDATASEGCGSA